MGSTPRRRVINSNNERQANRARQVCLLLVQSPYINLASTTGLTVRNLDAVRVAGHVGPVEPLDNLLTGGRLFKAYVLLNKVRSALAVGTRPPRRYAYFNEPMLKLLTAYINKKSATKKSFEKLNAYVEHFSSDLRQRGARSCVNKNNILSLFNSADAGSCIDSYSRLLYAKYLTHVRRFNRPSLLHTYTTTATKRPPSEIQITPAKLLRLEKEVLDFLPEYTNSSATSRARCSYKSNIRSAGF